MSGEEVAYACDPLQRLIVERNTCFLWCAMSSLFLLTACARPPQASGTDRITKEAKDPFEVLLQPRQSEKTSLSFTVVDTSFSLQKAREIATQDRQLIRSGRVLEQIVYSSSRKALEQYSLGTDEPAEGASSFADTDRLINQTGGPADAPVARLLRLSALFHTDQEQFTTNSSNIIMKFLGQPIQHFSEQVFEMLGSLRVEWTSGYSHVF
ncbi:MAG: hypothetical protein H7039_06510, partial [Bryobacteraceae bacterium]|nr:hypothetical protein [Bryobacteraceae bacterium]